MIEACTAGFKCHDIMQVVVAINRRRNRSVITIFRLRLFDIYIFMISCRYKQNANEFSLKYWFL